MSTGTDKRRKLTAVSTLWCIGSLLALAFIVEWGR